MSKKSVIDTSKPNAGRIYDYLLGGTHNFEADRQAADHVFKLLPFARKAAHLQRACLRDLAEELVEKRGFDIIIDFASGLPTQDHIHSVVSKGTTVIYSDIDPSIVEYGQDIIKDTPNTYFFQGDARHPEELINRPEVQEILGGRCNVGLVFWGVSAFLTDEEIKHSVNYLYEWSDNNSCLAFNVQGATINREDLAIKNLLETYQKMGSVIYLRPLETCKELLQPWRIDGEDFISLLAWHGFDESELTEEDIKSYGPTGAGHGAYLIK